MATNASSRAPRTASAGTNAPSSPPRIVRQYDQAVGEDTQEDSEDRLIGPVPHEIAQDSRRVLTRCQGERDDGDRERDAGDGNHRAGDRRQQPARAFRTGPEQSRPSLHQPLPAKPRVCLDQPHREDNAPTTITVGTNQRLDRRCSQRRRSLFRTIGARPPNAWHGEATAAKAARTIRLKQRRWETARANGGVSGIFGQPSRRPGDGQSRDQSKHALFMGLHLHRQRIGGLGMGFVGGVPGSDGPGCDGLGIRVRRLR